ncbi:MAG: hypothetical protein ACRD1Y_03800, partial [Terriglobales bacterium]
MPPPIPLEGVLFQPYNYPYLTLATDISQAHLDDFIWSFALRSLVGGAALGVGSALLGVSIFGPDGGEGAGASAHPSEIDGYAVSEHAFARMAKDMGHRVPPEVVGEAIQSGQTLPAPGEPGLVQKYLPNAHDGGVTVLLDPANREIISFRVGPPKGY